MSQKMLKKLGIGALWAIGSFYLMFLLMPFVMNPIVNGYTEILQSEINKATGLVSHIEGIKIITTPKLTAGIKIAKFGIDLPDNTPVLSADNFRVKMSLIPLLIRKIEVDAVQVEKVNADLKINPDGSFDIVKYFPEQADKKNEEQENSQAEETAEFKLPFGLKLSNRLPDMRVDEYSLTLKDGSDNYVISGDKTSVTDFIINKSVKVKGSAKAVFKGREQFSCNADILNKIMPDIELNDAVFNPEPQPETTENNMPEINITQILRGLYASNVTAKADVKLVTEPEDIRGNADFTNISILNLPPSNANLLFKNKQIDLKSDIYTAQNEVSHINGRFKTGKNPNADMSFKSDVEIANILKIVKQTALIFNIKELQTLTANGRINADFQVKSDLKTVKSNGMLKIPTAKLYYGAYNIGIDGINADVLMENNNINIQNIGFSILNQPLKFYGTVSEKAECDLHLIADKLSLKGLIVALGQASLLKDNNVNSGYISVNADITGRADKLNPLLKLNISDINIKNIPSNTVLKAPLTMVNINSDGKTFGGTAETSDIAVINPAVTVSIPKSEINIDDKIIELTKTPVRIGKINISTAGKIKNYMTEKIGLDFATDGDIKSKLAGSLDPQKQTLNLNYGTITQSKIIIPLFDKSEMTFTADTSITGHMANPVLRGSIIIPSLNIPEIPLVMNNADIKLDGVILNGSASVEKFASGGIEAQNVTGNFALKGDNFHLNNITGSAFDGKINGNIVYNLTSTLTGIDFHGSGMNAEKAVRGAVGIKNALSGTLGFDTKLKMIVSDFDKMMKSLNGNLSFKIDNGAFGTIGKIDSFFRADNIVNNVVLKNTVSALTNITGLADTAKYDYLKGSLTFSNGWADIKSITSTGSSLAYYVKGRYNLLNGTTNVVILGRLDGTVVAKLGPIGELSAEKLLSYIPVFGSATAKIVNTLTANPKNENVSAIPALSGNSVSHKDFKVEFNGGLESPSSVKSFKWLTVVDTSALQTQSVKESIDSLKSSLGSDLTNTVKGVADAVSGSKEQLNSAKEQLKNSADELKSLFKGFKP